MLKRAYKAVVTRALRAVLVETNDKLDTANHALAHIMRELVLLRTGRVGVWRGGLADGVAVLDDGSVSVEQTTKYRGELEFWVNLVKRPENLPGVDIVYEREFLTWQRDRLDELADWIGADDVGNWCAARTAVELGPGPYPMICVAQWRRAIAVDPLADGYVAEDLLPSNAHVDEVVWVAAPGEHTPLPAGHADLVVIENCLDHVSDPARVIAEIRRLLRPGGLVWLLVDLMTYTDAQHPHAFSEEKLRSLLAANGFEVVRDRVRDDHKSHPNADAEYRALLRKPGGEQPSPEVAVRTTAPARA